MSDVLPLATAVGLAVAAGALATAGRAGATRALAATARRQRSPGGEGLARGVPGFDWVETAPATVVALGLFALSPPLLALALRRAASGGPLRPDDTRVAGPAVIAVLALGAVLGVTAEVGRPALVVYLVGLNVVAAVSVGRAVRAARRLPERARWAGRGVVWVFAVHWLCSTASWVAAVGGLPGAHAFEAASLTTLLAFGVGAAALGLRRLPAVLLAAPVAEPRRRGRAVL